MSIADALRQHNNSDDEGGEGLLARSMYQPQDMGYSQSNRQTNRETQDWNQINIEDYQEESKDFAYPSLNSSTLKPPPPVTSNYAAKSTIGQ